MRSLQKLILILALITACSPSVPEKRILPAVKTVAEDKLIQNLETTADILFVIDDSGSMADHQQNLSLNIQKFVKAFSKKNVLDYHIGVINTGMDQGPYYQYCCGKLIGSPNYLDKNTPDFERILSDRMLLGVNGPGEEMAFDPVYAALTKPHLINENFGFYRPSANLVLIFITDAEEQSKILDPQSFYNFLLGLKQNSEKILAYGVLIPSNDTTFCPRDDGTKPSRYESFLGMVSNSGKNIINLCSPDFGNKLADLGDDLAQRLTSTFYLNQPPVPSTIRVMFGTQEILSHPENPSLGWFFDPSRNAIVLGDKIEYSNQPPGTKIQIYYDTAVVH